MSHGYNRKISVQKERVRRRLDFSGLSPCLVDSRPLGVKRRACCQPARRHVWKFNECHDAAKIVRMLNDFLLSTSVRHDSVCTLLPICLMTFAKLIDHSSMLNRLLRLARCLKS
jgi:hypothetical protein